MQVFNQVIKEEYAIYNGDCCDVIKGVPDASVGLSVFSPPFADLYAYSDDPRDMGNSRSYYDFFDHFRFLVKELFRVTEPGRHVVFHCMDMPIKKQEEGYIGLRDFPGDLIRLFSEENFIYHSRHTIWKDPLIEATRTKALGLMHKQIQKDSSMCRAGCPDYIIAMRKPGENKKPIAHENGFETFIGDGAPELSGVKFSHAVWRKYASPVWMDIRQTRTLNKNDARDEKDEKHICPLQLDTIERVIELWSRPGDVVLSPFMGIGSEGYCSVKMDRKFIGIELKESYFKQAVLNMLEAESKQTQGTILDLVQS